MWVRFLGWEDPLDKEMAICSSILPWKIPWIKRPGVLQPMGSQRVKNLGFFFFFSYWADCIFWKLHFVGCTVCKYFLPFHGCLFILLRIYGGGDPSEAQIGFMSWGDRAETPEKFRWLEFIQHNTREERTLQMEKPRDLGRLGLQDTAHRQLISHAWDEELWKEGSERIKGNNAQSWSRNGACYHYPLASLTQWTWIWANSQR